MFGWSKLLVVLAVASGGCAAAPPGPRGPLMGPGLKMATDWSLALSYATLERPGESDVTGSSDHYLLNLPVLPRRIEMRLSPVSWLDVGTEVGWLDGGLDVRVGFPAERGEFWAGNLAVGARTGQAGPFKDTKRQYSYWARTEVYPLLDESGGALQKSRRALLSLGVDVGAFYHQLELPEDPNYGEDGFGFNPAQLIRDEMRVEAAAGIVFLNRRASVLVALEPYLAFDLETDAGSCELCPRYRQSAGVVLVLDVALFLPFEDD